MKNQTLTALPARWLSAVQISDPEKLKWLYLAAVFFFWASMYFYVPTLPVFVESKTSDLAVVGVVLAQYGLWQSLFRLPLGILADWIGRRKPFILVGFALSGLGALLMANAASASGILAGRAVTGIAAATWVPLVVIYSNLFPAKDAVKAAITLTLVNSLSTMLATALNGTFNNWGGYPLAFYIGACVAGLSFLILLPAQEKRGVPKQPQLSSIGKLISRRDVLLPSILSAIAQYATWATTFGFFPVLARKLGASDILLGLLTSMNIGVVLLGNFLATWLIRKIEPKTLVYFSYVLISIGVLTAALAVTIPYLFFAQFCIGLSIGFNYPILMGKSIENVSEGERATAMGLYQAVYAIGMFSGPWLSGVLARSIGIQPMYAVTGFVILLLGLMGTSGLGKPINRRARPEI